MKPQNNATNGNWDPKDVGIEVVEEFNNGFPGQVDSRFVEGIGFQRGQLVHFHNGIVNPVTLQQALGSLSRLIRLSVKHKLDGSWSPTARARFFQLLTKAVR